MARSVPAARHRELTHALSHLAPPPAPPLPPLPPSLPPAAPPPPPLPYVLSASTAMIILFSVCAATVIVGILRVVARKKQTPSVPVTDDKTAAGGERPGDENELKGPEALRKRSCTDVFCLIFFVLFWFGMAYIQYLATTVGDPYMVLYGKDYLGNRCGRGNFSDRPKIIFPRIDQDILEQSAIATTAPWKLVLYGLCVQSCPNVTEPAVCFNDPARCMTYDYGQPDDWKAAGGSEYYFQVLPTISVVNRCIPTEKIDALAEPPRCAFPQCDNKTNPWMQCDDRFPTLWTPRGFWQQSQCEIKYEETQVKKLASQQPSPLVDQIASRMAQGQVVVRSILDAQTQILQFGLLCPVCLGFVWLILLRFFAKTITYLMLAAIGIGLFMMSIYLFIITGLMSEVMAELLENNATRALLLASEVVGDAGSGEFGSGDQALNLEGAATDISSLLPDSVAAKAAASQEENPVLWRYGAWACLIFTMIYVILMIMMRAKIRLAATLVKESSVVIKDRPASTLFPALTLIFQIGLLFFFVLGMLFLSTADITQDHFTGQGFPLGASATFAQMMQAANRSLNSEGVYVGAETSFTTKNVCYVYFVFGFLWTNQVLQNVSWTSLSGSYSHWYFFRRDSKHSSRVPLTWSVFRTFRYHFGSIAFGSFIIAAIQLLRIAMMWLDRQTKTLQESNKMMKMVIKTLQCALMCFEKTLKFITAYSYIYVALQGTGFCRSCVATFKLIMGQPAQLAMNTLVRSILSLIQLVGIPVASAFACNHVLTSYDVAEPFYPSLCVLLMAFIVAKVFALVFACVLDTLFVCCIRDKADYKAAFMSDQLYSAFGFDPAEREGGNGGDGSGAATHSGDSSAKGDAKQHL